MSSIYKYMTYRKEFFENFYLKLSMFGEFNDPFELVPGNFGATLSVDESEEFYSHHMHDPANYYDYIADAQCGVRASAGVICFTSRQDNLLMWAHYANNHKGICVEFDSSTSFFAGKYKDSCQLFGKTFEDIYEKIGLLKKVEYSEDRPLFLDPKEISYDTSSWFIKSTDWAYEEEYRILLPTDHAIREQELSFYQIDPQMIKSVIIGCQVDIDTKKEIHEKCLSLGINVKESFVNSSKFKLDIVNYHPDNQYRHINMFNLAKITQW